LFEVLQLGCGQFDNISGELIEAGAIAQPQSLDYFVAKLSRSWHNFWKI